MPKTLPWFGRFPAVAFALACFAMPVPAGAAPVIQISHRAPCNLFPAGEAVAFTATLKGFPSEGTPDLTARVRDYFGREVWTTAPAVTLVKGKPATVPLDVGALECGYYELTLDVKNPKATATVNFGVARLTTRTSAEALQQGSLGLKIFSIGDPGVWWRPGQVWNLAEAVDASAALGLQWTRHSFNQDPNPQQPGVIGTVELIQKHPMNVVLKVEGIPKEAYDAERYGPIEEYPKKNKKGFSRTTVPKKEPYQAWLRSEIAQIPAEQIVFEIGNEVWDYMSAEEFAEWCQLTVPVIREMRPNAIIGADPGNIEWGKHFIRAGGMKGMQMEILHPYCFTPLPEHRVRAWLRNRVEIHKELTGQTLDVYITEYGWNTAPASKGKPGVSERVSAQRTTRQSLMLYAEGCKTLIPHWMADREQDPTESEHWFGFFRLNGQPKPVVIAHHVCARMIDGGRFVGDLPMGEGVGAMLFEHGGVHTLALWTMDEAPGTGRNVSIPSVSPQVTLVNMVGAEQALAAKGGKLTFKASSDVSYLVGVDPALAKQVIPPDGELDTEVWTPRAGSAPLARIAAKPTIDGALDDWSGVAPLTLTARLKAGEKPAGDTEQVFLAWHADGLNVAVRSTGVRPPQSGDRVQIRFSTRPSRQLSLGSMGLYDYTLDLAPAGKTGPSLKLTNCTWDAPLVSPSPDDKSGVRWSVKPTDTGWTAEVFIPRTLLRNWPAEGGSKYSGYIELVRTGAKETGGNVRFGDAAIDPAETLRWPALVLQP